MDERELADTLDSVLDGLATDVDGVVDTLDPALLRIARRYQSLGHTPAPTGARERVRRAVLSGREPSPRDQEVPMNATDVFDAGRPLAGPNGRLTGSAAPWPRLRISAERRRTAPTFLATAALLLLTLGLGYLTLGPGRPHPPADRSVGIPASVATPPHRSVWIPRAVATPPASSGQREATLETVFATTLPAGTVPTAGHLSFILWHATLAPDTRVPIHGQIPGPQITHVVEGDLTIRVDGPLQVVRHADDTTSALGMAPAEAIPPGTEVVLRPGDTAVYGYERPAEYANLGATPVHIVGGGLFGGVIPGAAADLTFVDYNEWFPAPALPAGAVRATLVRATLPPGGVVPAAPPGALVREVGALGEVSIGENSDGSLRNGGPEATTIYILTWAPAGAATGTPMP